MSQDTSHDASHDTTGVASETKPARAYEFGWAIEGRTKITAESPDAARQAFDALSAHDLIRDGYDDIEVYEPEVEE